MRVWGEGARVAGERGGAEHPGPTSPVIPHARTHPPTHQHQHRLRQQRQLTAVLSSHPPPHTQHTLLMGLRFISSPLCSPPRSEASPQQAAGRPAQRRGAQWRGQRVARLCVWGGECVCVLGGVGAHDGGVKGQLAWGGGRGGSRQREAAPRHRQAGRQATSTSIPSPRPPTAITHPDHHPPHPPDCMRPSTECSCPTRSTSISTALCREPSWAVTARDAENASKVWVGGVGCRQGRGQQGEASRAAETQAPLPARKLARTPDRPTPPPHTHTQTPTHARTLTRTCSVNLACTKMKEGTPSTTCSSAWVGWWWGEWLCAWAGGWLGGGEGTRGSARCPMKRVGG